MIQPCRLQHTNIIYYLLHIVLLQGQLVFRLIGDLAGPNFFYINKTTGVIYVRNNLDLDRSQNYTLRVEVWYISASYAEIKMVLLYSHSQYLNAFCLHYWVSLIVNINKKKKTINVGTRNQMIKLNITYFSIPFMK